MLWPRGKPPIDAQVSDVILCTPCQRSRPRSPAKDPASTPPARSGEMPRTSCYRCSSITLSTIWGDTMGCGEVDEVQAGQQGAVKVIVIGAGKATQDGYDAGVQLMVRARQEGTHFSDLWPDAYAGRDDSIVHGPTTVGSPSRLTAPSTHFCPLESFTAGSTDQTGLSGADLVPKRPNVVPQKLDCLNCQWCDASPAIARAGVVHKCLRSDARSGVNG